MKKQILQCFLSIVIISAVMPNFLTAQTITTYVGCGIGNDSIATKAELSFPSGFVKDKYGNFYIGESGRIRKVTPAGIITTFAGNGFQGYWGDGGPAINATIADAYGLAIDKKGNMYITFNSQRSNYIRKIDTLGIITTIAGNDSAGYTGDGGLATAAKVNGPSSIVTDTLGNIIFADFGNHVIRKIDTAGIITTIVGNGITGATINGVAATATPMGLTTGLALDRKGNLYVSEAEYQYICKVDTASIITIIGGTGVYATGADGDGGPATDATMAVPMSMTLDTAGNLYFAEMYNNRVRKINLTTGIISNYAGNNTAGYSGDGGAATSAELSYLQSIYYDTLGYLYICDGNNNRVRRVDNSGVITTFAGQNNLFEEGYPASNAELLSPYYVATDIAGNLYIADGGNNRISKINASTGKISTVAGSGIAGYFDPYGGDGGPATNAKIYFPSAVAVDNIGNLYLSDNNDRIRKVDTFGIITTFAGNGVYGYFGENIAATNAKIAFPSGIAVDNAGNVYIADQGNFRIRKINALGIITTVAGNGVAGYTGDSGPATFAKLNYPADIAVDGFGNLFISDAGNNCIRKVDTTGIITTVAGNGTYGFAGDGGPATNAQLDNYTGIKADTFGNIFIVDEYNQRVRMVNAAGIITTIVGNGTAGYTGDGGPATSAELFYPCGIVLDNTGNVFIADLSNFRIRKVSGVLGVPKIFSSAIETITVFPNPATNQLQISNASGFSFSLLDLPGSIVVQGKINANQQTININSIANGVYIMQLFNDNGERKMLKIIKE